MISTKAIQQNLSMFFLMALIAVFSSIDTAGQQIDSWQKIQDDFKSTPLQYKTRPLWFWNAPLDEKTTSEIMEKSVESGYAGFGILPGQKMTPAFMTPEFLKQYRIAVDKASALGLKMCLYDEYWFPSGSAGGALAKLHPEALSQRLDMKEISVQGSSKVQEKIPSGRLMSVVAMNTNTLERINLSSSVKEGLLSWDSPAGSWKVMIFTCVIDGSGKLVDYLEPESVKKYVALTYDKYFAALSSHFGKTIDCAFYDEPTMHWVQGGRAWTPAFNDKFQSRYGFDPAPYYPALWYDIGSDTSAARNSLFGFRAELYADGFIKTLQDWCREHNIKLTGHQDQEEIVNPVGLCGDLMKSFRDQDMPGIDQIFSYGRASKAYKVISSAAYNYDRPMVMTECYGAMEKMPISTLYKEGMDQFAKGINMMVPHAVWYNPADITFPPELSYRSPVYGPALPAYNQYMGRLQKILQQGRHVVDIAVLYPIATLQSGYRFGVGTPYEGGIIPKEADYMDVGEMLSLQIRRDYTFVHPDILDTKCQIVKNEIKLDNKNNFENYKVLIIPGSKTISSSNIKKIKAFYDNGGIVISTTLLPVNSSEFGKDADVKAAVSSIFSGEETRTPSAVEPSATIVSASDIIKVANKNKNGGKAYFIPRPTAEILQAILNDALPVYDTTFEGNISVKNGNLTYIHKVIDGKNVYFFANSSETPIDTYITLRGKLALNEWNPHTGDIQKADSQSISQQSIEVARLHLILPPVQSRFYVEGN